MNENIYDAIKARIDQGQTYEQIQQDFLASGYDKEEFDEYYKRATDSGVAIPVKSKSRIWSGLPILLGGIILLLVSVGLFFYFTQIAQENTQTITGQADTEMEIASSSVSMTKKIDDAGSIPDAEIDEVVESGANEIAAKFTNDNEEGIVGFYEAYVEGVKFVEASSTPALTAMKNCLFNVYQNPTYSFTCYVNGIQGVESSPEVTQQSPYLFLTGPAVEHRLIWIASEQIPAATNITYASEGEEANGTLFVPDEYREDALEFIEQSEFSTRHNGRHFLGGLSQQEPQAHMIVYIDLDDPFSKHFYPTVLELRELYTVEELAIEVQHLPLTQLHPNASKLASASHCAAEQGDEYYWLFIEGVFAAREGNSAYEMSELPLLVQSIGLNDDDFRSCVEYGAYDSVITQQAQTIVTTGAVGTPHTIIFNRITGASEPEIMEGVLTLPELTSVVDLILDS